MKQTITVAFLSIIICFSCQIKQDSNKPQVPPIPCYLQLLKLAKWEVYQLMYLNHCITEQNDTIQLISCPLNLNNYQLYGDTIFFLIQFQCGKNNNYRFGKKSFLFSGIAMSISEKKVLFLEEDLSKFSYTDSMFFQLEKRRHPLTQKEEKIKIYLDTDSVLLSQKRSFCNYLKNNSENLSPFLKHQQIESCRKQHGKKKNQSPSNNH